MNLVEQLESKICELKSQEFPHDSELSFFEFLSKQILNSKDEFIVGTSDYIGALLALEGHDTFETIYDVILQTYQCINVDSRSNEENLTYLMNAIYTLKSVNVLNELLDFESEPTSEELKQLTKKYDMERDGTVPGEDDSRVAVGTCLMGYKMIGLTIFDTFTQLQSLARLISKCEDIDIKLPKFINFKNNYQETKFLRRNYSKIENRDKDNLSKIHEVLEASDISDVLKQIEDRYYNLSQEKEHFIKSNNKKIFLYKQMIEIINSLNKGKSIVVDEDIFLKLEDSELSLEFIKSLLEYNRMIYSKLEVENIKKDNYHQIEKLFWDNNLYIDLLSKDDRNILLRNGDVQKLEEVLTLLKNEEFSWLTVNHPNYVQVVLNTTPVILQTIINLIKNKVVSKNFVSRNVGILMDKIYIKVNDNDIEARYDIFRENMSELLNHTDYLSLKLDKNKDIVFMDIDSLRMALKLSNKYHLNLYSVNAKMYGLNILNTPESFDDLDQFIELGYAEYMKNNPQLLKVDSKDIIIRLSIMTNIGLNPMNKDNRLRGSITNGKNFYVPQGKLNNYRISMVDEYMKNDDFDILGEHKRMTISNLTEELEIVKYLDDLFKISDLEYQINGVIISRNKVLRNIECLVQNKDEYDDSSIALSAIIYHSVVDNNTIEFIKDKLNDYKKQYVKKKTYNV